MMAELKDRLLRVRWWMFHVNRRQVRRWLYQATRPASYPYISGDGFRRLARHIYDETNQNLNPEAVKDGDLVFVSTEYAHRFFVEVAPQIRSRFRLITHNSDVPTDNALASLGSDKIEAWFAQNNTSAHDKVIPIPIGLENLHHMYAGIPSHFDRARRFSGRRKPRALAGFTIATNPGERQRVHDISEQASCVDKLPARLDQSEYLAVLRTYQFLVSPPGNGLDTHRTWEAMYLGVVPIVKDSVPMRAFESRGLPLLVIPDWEILLELKEADLEAKYEELKGRFECPALWMPYWRALITSHGLRATRGREAQRGSANVAPGVWKE